MLLTKEVEVKLWGANVKYYNDKGYKGKQGDIITVKIEDLQHGSNVKVDVLCDYCKTKILHIPYYDYNTRMNKSGACACTKCYTIKVRETNILKYGVDSYAKTDKCKERIKATNRIKYGVDYGFQSEDVKTKIRETNLQKYGTEIPMQSKEVKEKHKQSCLQKYGVENPSQIAEVKQKRLNTFYERYGVHAAMQVDSVKEKSAKSLYKSGKCATSKQQRYLHNIYGGELNYPILYFLSDICFPDEKIAIEYNGSGHNLGVKTGQITQGKFNQREYYRSITFESQGYKTITIISSKDLLPSDTVLLQMLNEARTYFTTTPHTWCTFDIDNSTVRNAEHKTGIPYDFGELRQIKEAS